jgi:hypothetical protein
LSIIFKKVRACDAEACYSAPDSYMRAVERTLMKLLRIGISPVTEIL